MVDMSAIAGAAGALKTAYDLSKAALGLHEASAIQAKVIEMQGEISSALASAITAQTDQMAMLERIRDLERKITEFETWGTEKEKYEPVALAPNVIAFAMKEAVRGTTPQHYICGNCYNGGKKSFLQQVTRGSVHNRFRCNSCGEELSIETPGGARHSAMPSRARGTSTDWME